MTKLHANKDETGERYRAVEERLEPWMLLLSIAFVPIIVGSYAADISDEARRGFMIAGWLIWLAFAIEFAVLLYLAPNRRQMVKTHKLDLLIVLVPVLRPLRVLGLMRLATAGSAVGRAVAAMRRMGGRPGVVPFLRVVSLVIVAGAAFTLAFEHEREGSSISNFGEAMWWSFVTCTTVGYGDFSPVSTGGRIIAGILMLVGIAGLSLITASVAALFVEHDEETELELIRKQLDRIEAALDR